MVDEIQRLPGLLNEVHRFIEERGLRFALLGSSARKLRAAGVNLLAGRALWREMFPLTPEELGGDFDLDRTLQIGALPLVLASPRRTKPCAPTCSSTCARRSRVRRWCATCPASPASSPSPPCCTARSSTSPASPGMPAWPAPPSRATSRSSKTRCSHDVCRRYTARLRVRERRHPKLYWVDAGVARAAKGAHGPLIPEERGALLEGYIHTLLVTYMAERDLAQEIAYWSPAGSRRREVDFLLSRGSEHCALEIKAARRVQSQHLAGLRAIAPLPGLVRRVLVHQGERPGRTEDGIELWPIATLLDALRADRLWP